MAMTAWSANVRSNAVCFAERGPATGRATLIAPIAASPRIIGTMVMARYPLARKFLIPDANGAEA